MLAAEDTQVPLAAREVPQALPLALVREPVRVVPEQDTRQEADSQALRVALQEQAR